MTPMFMAGSDQTKAEFRIPSLLGALRFWYRATAPTNLVYKIPDLREAEAKLFGSSNTGQAAFLARADNSGLLFADTSTQIKKTQHGITYLGYGPVSFKKENQKQKNIQAGSSIKIKFFIRPIDKKSQTQPDIAGLIKAVKALSLFGGLGARSRRGFGSVTLLTLKDGNGNDLWRAPRNREELRTEISCFMDALTLRDKTEMPSYTAFSSMSRIIISQTNTDPFNLLDEIGQSMIRYRSYGSSRNGGPHNLPWHEEAEQNFAPDHDLLLSLRNDVDSVAHPRRVAFGLPHNYYFGSMRLRFDIAGDKSDRRASPLFIHIHELQEGYAAVLSYLPATFLPDNDLIKMEGNGVAASVPCAFDGTVITDFMDRIPAAMEVEL